MNKKPHVLILGCNFAGLTVSRFIRERCKDAVDMTVIDRKPYLVFVPNLPIEVFGNRDPVVSMHLPVSEILDKDDIRFIQADVTEVDPDNKTVRFVPTERLGAATERITYDYLVIALGARLAYDKIDGFGDFGHTLSDSYYGNKLRKYLHKGGYKGGPIAVGSARFHQGSKGKPDWLPEAKAACEGPPLEIALALASFLKYRNIGDAKNITLFTPAEIIAEDAGKSIMKKFLAMANDMGYGYKNNTQDIKRITAEGIEFVNGDSIDAELKIVLPDWQPHEFIRRLPVVDEVGFIITDLTMRSPQYPNIFALGDCAALTVPKLGALGHMQAGIVSKQIAKDLGKIPAEEADSPYRPEIICMGDMGDDKAFYVHSNEWFGGDISVLEMGYRYYAMKLGFKEMYFHTGGKVPRWGVPLTEWVGESRSERAAER